MTLVPSEKVPTKQTGRELRRPRLTRIKAKVPSSVKNGPKALQGHLLTAAARRIRRNVDARSAVVISSWPRSGSTWLFEMFASDRTVLPVFEPFHPTHNPAFVPFADELGFTAPPEAGTSDLSTLVQEVATGRHLTRWSANRARRDRIWRARRTLLKEVRLGPAVPWLAEELPVPTVVLLRHPCAVIESALRSTGEWQWWPEEQIRRVLAARTEDDSVEIRLQDAERPELLAALWAMDAATALAVAREKDSVEVVAYEELVRATDDVLARLADHTGLVDMSAEPERLSLQTDKTSHLRQGVRDPLAGWKGKLAEHDAQRILETVHSFGIDFYTEDLEPDYELLRAAVSSEVAGS